MLQRVDENPLLGPEDLKPTVEGAEVMCTLNPAAVRVGPETLLLVRVGEKAPVEDGYVSYLRWDPETGNTVVGRLKIGDPDLVTTDPRGYYYRGKMLLTSISHLRIARSNDGRNFSFDPEPALYPATPYEAYGCEDPRITHIDGKYYITYTAVSDRGVTVGLASTNDFARFERHPIIFPPYQKDVCIFPEKIRDMYVCRHRPYKNEFNDACIWTAYSPDMLCWGLHEQTLTPRPGTWEGGRVGCGAAPVRTEEGWLEIYHAADESGRYHLGAMLSDMEHPERVTHRGSKPVLEPEADYEITGIYGNCVFSNGLVVDDDGRMTVYYGAADRICAAAITSVDEMVEAAKA
ncbi:MAG: glycoside hydrolase family 130 protein [Phycisphaerae bacterium]